MSESALLIVILAISTILGVMFVSRSVSYTKWHTAFIIHGVKIIYRCNLLDGEVQFKMRMPSDKVE